MCECTHSNENKQPVISRFHFSWLSSFLEKFEIPIFIIGVAFFIAALFSSNPSLKLGLYIVSYILTAYRIVYYALRNLFYKDFFNENTLMTLASLGAFGIKSYGEAVAVIIFYTIGEFLQDKAVDRSKKSIESLLFMKPKVAHRKENNQFVSLNPDLIQKGDILLIKVGEMVPVDGKIVKGETYLNTSSLTGESLPLQVQESDSILSGSINLSHVIEIEALKAFKDSTFSRIMDLIQNTQNTKANTEKFITRFARIYTPFVFFLALFIMLFPPFVLGLPFEHWFKTALIFLVISCPCALTLSVPLSFFCGIGRSSKNGILIKGTQFIEKLARIKNIVFDKTGTLTNGHFSIKAIHAFSLSQQEVLHIIASLEKYSTHPISKGIIEKYNLLYPEKALVDFSSFEIQEIFGKGLHVKNEKEEYLVGSEKLLKQFNISYDKSSVDFIYTNIFLVKNEQCLGFIELEDSLKESSMKTIHLLNKKGVATYLLSGDNPLIVKNIAKKLGIDKEKALGNLLPQEKLQKLEEIMSSKKLTAFVGDGVNDAPSLKMADLGISIGTTGSDIAIESSDVVLMSSQPIKILQAMKTALKTIFVTYENIIFAIGIKIIFMILGVTAQINMIESIFADVGVTLIAVLNSMRILKK
jgi:Cd2+/Zn2+-exporting ATPase